MPKSIYINFLVEQPGFNIHFLNRLVKILNHFISIEIKDKSNGFHFHHIVPKSWKSEWIKEPENLLKVPSKAHYVIHHLMWKAFPKDYAMMHAFERMVNSNRYEQKITSKIYEKLMSQFSERSSSRMKLYHQNNPYAVKREK